MSIIVIKNCPFPFFFLLPTQGSTFYIEIYDVAGEHNVAIIVIIEIVIHILCEHNVHPPTWSGYCPLQAVSLYLIF